MPVHNWNACLGVLWRKRKMKRWLQKTFLERDINLFSRFQASNIQASTQRIINGQTLEYAIEHWIYDCDYSIIHFALTRVLRYILSNDQVSLWNIIKSAKLGYIFSMIIFMTIKFHPFTEFEIIFLSLSLIICIIFLKRKFYHL